MANYQIDGAFNKTRVSAAYDRFMCVSTGCFLGYIEVQQNKK